MGSQRSCTASRHPIWCRMRAAEGWIVMLAPQAGATVCLSRTTKSMPASCNAWAKVRPPTPAPTITTLKAASFPFPFVATMAEEVDKGEWITAQYRIKQIVPQEDEIKSST